MKYNKKKIMIIVSIIATLIILIGSVYAFFTYFKNANAFILTSNSISALFTSGSNQISFENAYPISDEYALQNINKLDYIDFTVSGNASNNQEAITYEIFLTEVNGNSLSNNYVKLYLTDNSGNEVTNPTLYSSLNATSYGNEPTGKTIYKDRVKGQFSKSYRLYCWLDSSFENNNISSTFSFYVNLYAYNDTSEGIYTVTFDYNDGVTESTTKQVTYHETYGLLPQPTREGYTFLGWNGKNLLSDVQIGLAWNDDRNSDRAVAYADVKPNTQYSISFNDISNLVDNNSGNDGLYYFYKINKSDNTTLTGPNKITSNNVVTTYSTTNYLGIQFNKTNISLSDVETVKVQIEEGSAATEYEPYYITSDTRVVQNKDHTLKAIWEENE